MLYELVGKAPIYSLMGNAAAELAAACEKRNESDAVTAYTKVCAYAMDLEIAPDKEATRAVINEVFAKMSPQQMDELTEAVKAHIESNKAEEDCDEGLE